MIARVSDEEREITGLERSKAAIAQYRWKRGQSGNPLGRAIQSRSQEVLAKAKRLAAGSAIEAVATLVAIMRASSDEKLRAWCAREVLRTAGEIPVQVVKAQRGEGSSPLLTKNAADLQAMFDRVGQEALHALDQGAKSIEIELTERTATVRDIGQATENEVPGSRGGEGVCLTGTPGESRGKRSDPEIEADTDD